ncbi:MAG: Fic family protein [Candidatus Omnitrophota bacterium]
MNIAEIQKGIQQLRKQNIDFIAVSNSEWYSLFKDEIRNSIAIEGVFANRNELLDVLEKNKRADNEKTAAILGYFEAASSMYEYAHNQYKEQEFILRISDIKQIHTLLMKYEKELGTYTGDLGGFRKGDIEVARATFKPIGVFYVRNVMELFVKWIDTKFNDKKYDRLLLAAASHVWFETIHPFRDGNGRVGRILLSYIFIGCGFVNIAIKGISKSQREKYYKALEVCDDCFEKIHSDIEQGKDVSIRDVDNYMKGVDFTAFKDILKERLEESIKRLQSSKKIRLDKDAVCSLRDLAGAFNYSQDYLRNLINRKQLKAIKRGKLWYVRVRDMQRYMDRLSKKK